MSEDEQVEILRRHGHPLIVASRYRAGQQLIGPVFFPMYVFALKTGLGVALLVTVVLAGAAAVLRGDPGQHALEPWALFPAALSLAEIGREVYPRERARACADCTGLRDGGPTLEVL